MPATLPPHYSLRHVYSALIRKWITASVILYFVCGVISPVLAQLNTAIDLSTYVRIGRYDLPEPTRTAHPANNLLAQEVSAVTYNWDLNSLFVVGDGGTAIVQVSKTGALINTMTLATGSSPQGTEFYDPEGLAYIGNGKFVMTEERDRRAVLFTYVAGGILTRADAKTVTLGTFVQNIGLEGLTYDPQTNGFIFAKEKDPLGIFQTTIDFENGTASNGSATTTNSTNLFDPALTGMSDLADIFALSNIPGLNGLPNAGNLLVLSHEQAKIINISRSGTISSTLNIMSDPGNPLSLEAQQHEGLTMDHDGILYVVSENGGGDFDHPQLWVYAPSTQPNQPPTDISLTNTTTTLLENTSTLTPIKVADVIVTDDGLGTNYLSLSGTDAAYFEISVGSLFIKAGTVLDFESKATYNVTINVDDPAVGVSPDDAVNFTLQLTDVPNEVVTVPPVTISEVAPWSSGNSPVGTDWFEITNNGTTDLDITGWKVDDGSNSFASAAALNGITVIKPGESVIFIETNDLNAKKTLFLNTWFGVNPPTGLQIGSYSGSGLGLSTGGDGVSVFDAGGILKAKVSFGTSPAGPFPTFDNGKGLDNSDISLLSKTGVFGAFAAINNTQEIGSPGTIGNLVITEVAPWSSGNSPVGSDWFELTNQKAIPVNVTGWKMDDNSNSFGSAVALNGVTTIAPGESVIFMETNDPANKVPSFLSNWFGANPPTGLKVGFYSGSGVGLSTGGDAVNIFNSNGILQAGVSFGSSPSGPSFPTFDNKAGLNNASISLLSAIGVNGAFSAINSANEIGSPGTVGSLFISEVAPWSSGNSPVGADWFEVTNTKSVPVDITGWKMDDNSGSPAAAVALSGITTIEPGESVIFIETATPLTTIPQFLSNWFGSNIPGSLKVGSYTGSGVGLGTGGDAVHLYNAANQLQVSLFFGASPSSTPYKTFDNTAGLNHTNITQLSETGVNGAFIAVNSPNEIGSPGLIWGETTLPLTLVDFRGEVVNGNQAVLKWITENESKLQMFTVERSENGSLFSAIGQLDPNHNSLRNHYSLTDKIPVAGKVFYRLKIMEKDGRISYSRVISLQAELLTGAMVAPNPVIRGHEAWLTINAVSGNGMAEIILTNSEGRMIRKKNAPLQEGLNRISFYTSDLSCGLYFVQIRLGEQLIVVKLMVQ